MRRQLTAPAKINLGLAVTGRLPGGFHRIDTVFARLDLVDEVQVTVERSEETSARAVLAPAGDGAPRLDPAEFPLDARNLAVQAALRYLAVAGQSAEVTVRLRKGIPVAAGLGGGSSDGAAVLTALAQLVPAGVDLTAVGLDLGSDVPFFLAHRPVMRGGGRGEALEPLTLPPLHVVLANPGISVSAADAYSLLGALGEPLHVERLSTELREGSEPSYRNDLQPGVVARHPEIREVLETLLGLSLQGVMMSGSGSTCFGIARSAEHAETIAAEIRRNRPEWWVWSGRAAV